MLSRKDELQVIKNAKSAHLNAQNIMSDAIFKKIDGTKITNVPEYIKKYFEDKRRESMYNEFEIFIGTDSQRVRRGRLTLYASVICLYTKGKGAHLIYTRVKRDDISPTTKKTSMVKGNDPMLYQRLWWEVEYSMQITNYLKDNGVFTECGIGQVHLDISANPDNKSNVVYKSAIGYVESYGYNVRNKPNAPASSYAADFLVRG